MEADVIYRAKDGRTFTDPLKCEDYEKTLGILKGSVGDLVNRLGAFNPDCYVIGIIKVNDGGKGTIYARFTMCLDHYLEDYVNPENLTKEQRYATYTIGGLIRALREINQDAPCQYMIMFDSDIDFKDNKIMANWNDKAWDQQDKDI